MTMPQLTRPDGIAFAPVGDIGITVHQETQWADRFNAGDRVVELWSCKRNHRGPCHPDKLCAQEGSGKMLGVWTGPWTAIPPTLARLDRTAFAAPTTLSSLVTIVIYERTA